MFFRNLICFFFKRFNIVSVAVSVSASIIVLRFHFRGHQSQRLFKFMRTLLFMNSNSNNLNYRLEKLQKKMKSSSFKRMNKIRNKLINRDEQQQHQPFDLVLKLIKNTNKLLRRNKFERDITEITKTEWKEAALRIDKILFCLSALNVIVTPIILFTKYLFTNYSISSSGNCQCNL